MSFVAGRARVWPAIVFACLLGAALAACNNTAGPATPAPLPDMVLLCPPVACVAEDHEDCAGCFQRIADCCYGDNNLGGPFGTIDKLLTECAENPGCVSCCNECAQLSCRDLQRHHVCPWVAPDMMVK